MAQQSSIEWTDATWNPIRGCTRKSPGCGRCYAEMMAARFSGPGLPFEGFARMTPAGPRWTGRIELMEHLLGEPLRWKLSCRIFVNSMSDMFHEKLPVEAILRVFEVMNRADWHQYQILTKRSERLPEMDTTLPWAPHIWMGVSIESNDYLFRAEHLKQTRAAVKFLSLEPLLGPLPDLDLNGIDWVITGGESGPHARPMAEAWVLDIRDRCLAAGVPFFFKQWGGVNKKAAGRVLQGRTWEEMPKVKLISGKRHGAQAGGAISLGVLEA